MHEAAIASGILDAVTEALEGRGPVTLRLVRVRVGRFAGVVPECLDFAWEVIRDGTIAEGVPLEIEDVPATARCEDCGANWVLEDVCLQCPDCCGRRVVMLTGRELTVSELEVDESPDAGGTA